MTTLTQVNEYFTRNFRELSKKGEVFLELENKKEPFEGGVSILVKASSYLNLLTSYSVQAIIYVFNN